MDNRAQVISSTTSPAANTSNYGRAHSLYASPSEVRPYYYDSSGEIYGSPTDPGPLVGEMQVTGGADRERLLQRQSSCNHFALALFSIFCCCPIIGIFALVVSAMSSQAHNEGNVQEAQRKAELSRNISVGAISVGIVLSAIFTIVYCIKVE